MQKECSRHKEVSASAKRPRALRRGSFTGKLAMVSTKGHQAKKLKLNQTKLAQEKAEKKRKTTWAEKLPTSIKEKEIHRLNRAVSPLHRKK
eukprot:1159331-Pelagomonas_calceolata.AAC.13